MNGNLRAVCAFAILATFLLTTSCTGFFVNPTLSTISVGPASPTIETGNTNNTVQMTSFGTNSDGSTTNSPSVSWTITPTTVATISSTGLVTSAGTGTATVTATSNKNPSITGTQTVNVTVGCINSITVDPSNASISVGGTPHTQNFTATAHTCNGSTDITNAATWTSSNTSVATVAGGVATAVAVGTVNITATSGNIVSNNAVLNVGP